MTEPEPNDAGEAERAEAPATPEPPSREAAPSAPSALRRPAVELAIGAAVLLGIRAGLELVDGVLTSAPLASVVIGALVVDVIAGRAGLVWSGEDELARTQARRAATGALAGLVVFALVVAIGTALGFTTLASGHPDGMVVLTLVGAGATAVRDELLLRGLPLMYATRAGVPTRWAVVFAAALSPAFIGATAATSPGSVVVALGSGLFFACAYRFAGGATAAIGAHAAWLFAVGPLAKGVFEIGWKRGDLGDGTASAGAPAFIAAALFVAVAAATPRLAARLRLGETPAEDAAAPVAEANDVSARRPRPARSERAPSRKTPSSP